MTNLLAIAALSVLAIVLILCATSSTVHEVVLRRDEPVSPANPANEGDR